MNSATQQHRPLEAQLQATLNVIPAYAWYATPSGALTFVNERTADYLGLPKDHPLRFGIDIGGEWDAHIPLLHPDDREESRRIWSICLQTGSAKESSIRIRNAEGGYRWFQTRVEPLRASDGTLLYWIGINLDIEERKQAEFYLEEGQRLGHMGSWAFSAAGFDYWSSELFHVHGLDPRGKPPTIEEYLALVHPEDRGFMEQGIQKMLTDHRGFDFTKRIVRPDGQVRHVRCVGVPVTDGVTSHKFVGTGMDITEQEQLTGELRRSEYYLAEGQRLAHMGSWVFDPAGFFSYWSRELFQIYGLDPAKEAPSLKRYLACVHPQERDFMASLIQRVVTDADASGCDVTQRIVRPDGEIRHVRCVGAPVVENGTLKSIIGTAIDVTGHKLLTQELRRREAYLAEAQRLSHTGSFGWRPDTGAILWSDETYRIFEYDRSVTPTIDLIVQRVHPEDRADFQEVINQASLRGADFEHTYRLLMPDGRVKHFHALAHATQDESGNREFLGAGTDITERKNAEEKVREREEELRQMLDLTPQLAAVFGARRERLRANRILLDYLGLSNEEWLQQSDQSEGVHPDDRDRLNDAFDRALSTGSAFETETRIRRGDGRYRWFLGRYNPLRDDKGQITRWYAAGTDIEERKQAEERLRHENIALQEEISKASMFEEIVGDSPALRTVLSRVSKVAPASSTVLITGETGTGKELIARAIHRRSRRCSRPFVSVNCAAIPRDLIASELFGHEKGAFTGALQRRLGKFELAEGGTIFLDEVGELPAETQIALLRVLQEHEFQRVGGNQAVRTDVRVISATNRDLQSAIAASIFRSDLFYRLNVFPIEVPPLRKRKEDIAMLVEYFIDRYARQAGKKIKSVDKRTLELVQAYPWPGNIRELQNVIERSVVLCETEIFSVDESWLSRASSSFQAASPMLSNKPTPREREIIETALAKTRGRVSGPAGAAAKLGIPSTTLESKIKSLKINKHHFKAS